MAFILFVTFLSTRHQTIVLRLFLELQDIGIENFNVLSMLFSNLHFAFTRSPEHVDTTTSASVPRR